MSDVYKVLEMQRRALQDEVFAAWSELEKLLRKKYTAWDKPRGIDDIIAVVEKRLLDARAAYDELVAQ